METINDYDGLKLKWDVLILANVLEKLISEADQYFFFEKGMRGRVPYISKRYSKANNKY